MAYYDQWGWYSETEITGRFTDTPVPENIPDGYAANWTGHSWAVIPYIAPNTNTVTTPSDHPERITKLAFRKRFTDAERVGIEIASMDIPTAPNEQRVLAASLRANQQDVSVAMYIDLSDPVTRAGVEQLEAIGLLGTGRAAEILDTVATEHELFIG